MPIYEYECVPCEETFEALIRTDADVVRCPKCGNLQVTRCLSAPAAARVGGGTAGSSLPMMSDGGACGRPQCGGGRCAGLG